MSYTLVLRTAEFDRAVVAAGYSSVDDFAGRVGLPVEEVGVVRGGGEPSTEFIAEALVALAPVTFANLFEIVDRPL
ncbi:hypothetical protein GCM10022243_60410 [Saccharothrix violaceirubra]|uniref:Isopentenyl diphosphate isomerase/L-lactate dehydrogenase-like FMN-dependent dehydrogenase n=1 Tax=Saccharothrix violaceirubra TaxID=413306 RepID=A0A7W7T7I7_9PSEU|nr:transcriptional regulator [Saccharothrix violaceirubra]MBB4968018.1 isopentenyl diphosphate isomerase/L-lactate dehydrogenase-like FMN-dependent dehydrogenase [Saccharothrix violaceirubra]